MPNSVVIVASVPASPLLLLVVCVTTLCNGVTEVLATQAIARSLALFIASTVSASCSAITVLPVSK